jgi:hypothetical protein
MRLDAMRVDCEYNAGCKGPCATSRSLFRMAMSAGAVLKYEFNRILSVEALAAT